MSREEIQSTARSPLILRWISRMFARELTSGDLESYRAGEGRAFIEMLQSEYPEAVELGRISCILDGPERTDVAALEFASSFSWLFHGVGGSKAVPPYQHDWSEASDGSQMECIGRCMELMSQCGLGPAHASGEPADHISVQLEFLSYLEEKALSEPDGPWHNCRDQLLREHLSVWLPLFLTACEQNDRNGLYASLAGLTRRFLPNVMRDSDDLSFAMNAR